MTTAQFAKQLNDLKEKIWIQASRYFLIPPFLALVFLGCPERVLAYSLPAAGGEIGTSATMIGHGSIEGFSKGASSIFENSATLMGDKQGYSASTMWCQFTATEATYWDLAGAVSFDPQYAISAGIIKTSIANIDITELNGLGEAASAGTFSVGSTTTMLGGRWTLNKDTQLGVTMKSLSSSLSPTMSGTSLDFDPGVLFNTEYGQFSVVARNIMGSAITYSDGSKESVPREFIGSYRSDPISEYQISVMAQVRKRGNFYPKAIGATAPIGSKTLMVSTGWREDLVVNTIRPRLSLGLSLILDSLSINYALEPSDYFQQTNQHYVSIEFY